MYSNLKIVVRTAVGLVILMIGIIGMLIPVLPGWLLILVAIPIINPEYGKKAVEKLKSWTRKK